MKKNPSILVASDVPGSSEAHSSDKCDPWKKRIFSFWILTIIWKILEGYLTPEH